MAERKRQVRPKPALDKTIFATRRDNLRYLVETRGGVTAIATLCGYASHSYLSQLLHRTGKTIAESSARHIERSLTLPQGWLDQPHTEVSRMFPTGAPSTPVTQTPAPRSMELDLLRLGAALQARGVTLPPHRVGPLLTVLRVAKLDLNDASAVDALAELLR